MWLSSFIKPGMPAAVRWRLGNCIIWCFPLTRVPTFSGKVSAHWEINITVPKEAFSLVKCPLHHLTLQLLAQWLSPPAARISRFLSRWWLPKLCWGTWVSWVGTRGIWSRLRYLPGVWMAVLMPLSPESCSVGNHNLWLKKPVKNSLESWISYMISYYGSF